MSYQIEIEELELSAYLGVPEVERREAQRLTVTLRLEMPHDCHDDTIRCTVDYFLVAQAIQAEARRRPRHLLETLADDLAAMVLRDFPVGAVELKVRKYILPDAQAVAVKIYRSRATVR